jgi:MSHA biogenesis protein MshI
MWRPFKKGAANDSRSGLSIDDSRVAFASAQRRKDGTLRVAASLFDGSGNNSGKDLQLAARMDKVDPRRSKVTAVLPDSSYQVLLLEVPNVPEDEVNDAARWQVKDLLDFPVDETVVELFKLPRQATADGKPIGYAVAARRRSIQEHIELFNSAGLSLDVIDIPELCQRNVATLLPQDAHGVAFLHFTQNRGILTITRQGVLYLVRRIEKGHSAISAAATGEFAVADLEATSELDILRSPDEEVDYGDNFSRSELVTTIVLEVQRSLDFYDSHYDCPPVSELVLSPGSNIGGLAKTLNDQLGLAVSSLNLNRLFEMQTELSSQQQGACLLAIGAALRSESLAA